jgi:tripartite-type tricarboxylate transporter receptor subunit TctC
VIGSHISAAVSETGAALSLVLEGKVSALGITASVPHPALPQVPTIADAVGMPGFEAVSWHVLLAPAATPRPVVERLHAEMSRITAGKAFQKRVTEIGLMPLDPRPIEEISRYIDGERARWSGVVTELGLAGSQ